MAVVVMSRASGGEVGGLDEAAVGEVASGGEGEQAGGAEGAGGVEAVLEGQGEGVAGMEAAVAGEAVEVQGLAGAAEEGAGVVAQVVCSEVQGGAGAEVAGGVGEGVAQGEGEVLSGAEGAGGVVQGGAGDLDVGGVEAVVWGRAVSPVVARVWVAGGAVMGVLWLSRVVVVMSRVPAAVMRPSWLFRVSWRWRRVSPPLWRRPPVLVRVVPSIWRVPLLLMCPAVVLSMVVVCRWVAVWESMVPPRLSRVVVCRSRVSAARRVPPSRLVRGGAGVDGEGGGGLEEAGGVVQ